MADSPQRRRELRRNLEDEVGAKEARKLKARREKHRNIWFGLGMFGLVGWSVAIPALLGTAIGYWMDRTWPGQVSWTLTGLLIGIALGCWNAWNWISRESRRG